MKCRRHPAQVHGNHGLQKAESFISGCEQWLNEPPTGDSGKLFTDAEMPFNEQSPLRPCFSGPLIRFAFGYSS